MNSNKEKQILHAGFFAGEFGWQIMRWQAHLRHLSKKYKIVVGCEEQYKYLYEDFAEYFIFFDKIVESRNMWLANQQTYPIKANCLVPSKEICLNDNLEQCFIKFGQKMSTNTGLVLIHARSTNNLKTGYRNYDTSKFEEIVRKLNYLNFASIGTIKDSDHIKGTKDFRGINLKTLCNIMRNSKLLLSPSSGPAHLASLCGLTHIVWSGNDVGVMKNEDRYLKKWNPLNTKCIFINSWQPSTDLIIKRVRECLSQ